MNESSKMSVMLEFENCCHNLHHGYCEVCKHVRVLKLDQSANQCSECTGDVDKRVTELKELGLLPVWIDSNGITRYDVPEELQGLRDAEKMLIQILSPYVPLIHIRNGTLGLRGHVCCFSQSIEDVIPVVELPRKPNDVDMIQMIQKYIDSEGRVNCKSFMIRHSKVIRPLQFLVRHNTVYEKYATLVFDNLSWMNGAEEAELPGV